MSPRRGTLRWLRQLGALLRSPWRRGGATAGLGSGRKILRGHGPGGVRGLEDLRRLQRIWRELTQERDQDLVEQALALAIGDRGGVEARFTGLEPFVALHAVPFVVSAREGRRVTGVDVQDIARGFC